MSVYDVPPQKLIVKAAEEIKKLDKLKPPLWVSYTKTGVCAERPPQQPDFWFLRAAAILRRLYIAERPIGTRRMQTIFGGRRRRGHKPAHHKKAGGKIIRTILQQLEACGFVEKVEKPRKGRIITSRGRSFLDRIAAKVA